MSDLGRKLILFCLRGYTCLLVEEVLHSQQALTAVLDAHRSKGVSWDVVLIGCRARRGHTAGQLRSCWGAGLHSSNSCQS